MKYIEWIPPEDSQGLKPDRPVVRHLKKMVIWVLTRIIPKANPDFEQDYDNVKKWWLEIEEKGLPVREIGFDKNGEEIVIGPIDGNFGMVTDSPMMFDNEPNVKQIEDEFQIVWKKYEDKYRERVLSENHK